MKKTKIKNKGKELYPICTNCENPFPHIYASGGGHCEDCGHTWEAKKSK